MEKAQMGTLGVGGAIHMLQANHKPSANSGRQTRFEMQTINPNPIGFSINECCQSSTDYLALT
jgi:hypothetical protein